MVRLSGDRNDAIRLVLVRYIDRISAQNIAQILFRTVSSGSPIAENPTACRKTPPCCVRDLNTPFSPWFESVWIPCCRDPGVSLEPERVAYTPEVRQWTGGDGQADQDQHRPREPG